MTVKLELLCLVSWLCLCHSSDIIDVNGWNTEKYYLPQEIVGEHSAAIIQKDYLYQFGGLKLEPFIGIDKVARLSINNPKEWEIITNMTIDDGFEQPWFTSTKGANLLESEPDYIFLTCEDAQKGQIWKFNIYTYKFEIITIMPIPLEDCCAISDNNKMYIFGGQDNIAYNYTQIYDYEKDEWSLGENIPVEGIILNSCENFNNEYIYLFGGMIDNGTNINKNVYKYDIQNDKWITIENVFENDEDYKDGIAFVGTNYIPDTKYILLTGGEKFAIGDNPEEERWLNNVLLFNTEKDEIETDLILPKLNENRGGATYSVYVEQQNKKKSVVRVYVVGGRYQKDLPIYSATTETIEFTINCEDKESDKGYKKEILVGYHGNEVKMGGEYVTGMYIVGILCFAGLFLVIGFVCGIWGFHGGVYQNTKVLSLSDETESEGMDD